jgi:hypothetical protein
MNFDDTARFFGSSAKLWPELFQPRLRSAKFMCRDCRRIEVTQKVLYCGRCAHNRKLATNRESYRRALDSGKVADSPLGAEALRKPESVTGYSDPSGQFLAKGGAL